MNRPTFQRLPVDHLDTQNNIREDYGNLGALASTFEDGGPEEPPVVYPHGQRYVVEAGNRRVEAARQAGITHLWCVVKPLSFDPTELRRRQLIADLHHKALAPLERAKAMRGLLEETPGLTKAGLARLLGLSKTEVTRMVAFLDLADSVQQAVRDEHISQSIAELLIPLSTEDQKRILPQILDTAGERSDKPTVAAARRVIEVAAISKKKRRRGRPRSSKRSAQPQSEAERKRQGADKDEQLDVYDTLIASGEPVLAVHLLYEVSQAAYSVMEAWRVCELDGCSDNLRHQISEAAGQMRDIAEKIQSATR